VAEGTSSWPDRHDLDLTRFIDGAENPTLVEAPEVVLVPEGEPGAGGTILLLQKSPHDAAEWEALPVAEQERIIGRTRLERLEPLAAMLESMAGLANGTRDALADYTRPLTGAYYFVPSTDTLLRIGGVADPE
jgi:porphyrinogen peroxidase